MCFITIEMSNAEAELWAGYTWWRLTHSTNAQASINMAYRHCYSFPGCHQEVQRLDPHQTLGHSCFFNS